jgi:hypothetical protein
MDREEAKIIEIAKRKGEELNKLFKSKKIDYDAIFKIILSTDNFQRQVISDHISNNHSKSILILIEDKLKGDLRDILTYMFYNPYELDARLLYKSFQGFRTDTKVIIEIFATRPKWYLELVDKEYERIYKRSLKSELEKKKNKDFYKFLLCLFNTERGEGKHMDISEGEKIVEEMKTKGLKAYGNNLELFKKVFVLPSREDFILIARIFFKNNPKKKNLYQAVDDQVGGDNRELLKALVYAVCDPSHYFAHCLKKAIVGLGTNTKTLNRILTCRSEIDMDVIRERYKGETNRELIDDIKGDCTGEYGKFLVELASKTPEEE